MKHLHQTLGLLLAYLLMGVLVSCTKPSGRDDDNTNGGTIPQTPGTLAQYERIPIPGVDFQAHIGAMPTQFFCTNIGPYVNVFNGGAKSNTTYKYRGGSGDDAWISYPAESLLFSFTPSKFYNEERDELSYFWSNADLDFEYAYGMNNLGNGSPSFKYRLRGLDDDNQPSAFSFVYAPVSGLAKVWAIYFNEVWHEGATSEDFDLVARLKAPGTEDGDVDNTLFGGFVDPDAGSIFWCRGYTLVYKINLASHQIQSWDLSSLGAGYVTAITKANDKIYVEYGSKVLEEDGGQLNVIGDLNMELTQTAWATIASDGNTLFASNGTYYDKADNTWKSFIGTRTNLNITDAALYDKLQEYTKRGYPIAVTQGGGPVYILTGEELIKIYPKL